MIRQRNNRWPKQENKLINAKPDSEYKYDNIELKVHAKPVATIRKSNEALISARETIIKFHVCVFGWKPEWC